MILTLFEIGLWVSLAIYLIVGRVVLHRRQTQAWERLVEQLQPQEAVPGLKFQYSLDERNTSPEVRWHHIQCSHDLWAMYENARIMLDMANFAAANAAVVDSAMLEALRSDAMQIRVCVLVELSRHAYSQVSEGTLANVARATAAYSDMVVRMGNLLEANRGKLVPGFAPVL
jgi:hypothetical protein